MAVQKKDTGKIYVGISWICKGLQLSKSQKDTQIQNIQNDFVLKRGCLKFQAGVFDKNNMTLALDINYLPLWLAKISITPKMIEDTPELAERLADYQIKAKDVLAKAFLSEEKIDIIIQDYLQLDEDERAIIFFQERKERKKLEKEKVLLEEKTKELEPKAESFDQLISAKNNQTMNQVAKSFKTGRNRLFKFLRDKGILMNNNMPYQQYIEQNLFIVREYTIPIGNELINKTQTLVTAKGIKFIDKLLKKMDYDLGQKEKALANA